VQSVGFSGAGDFAGPDVQAVGLLTVDAELFKAFLQPLPVLLTFRLGEHGGLRVLLRVALEDAGADEKYCVVYGVYQRLGIVENELAGGDSVFEPEHEVFGGWGGLWVWFRRCGFWFGKWLLRINRCWWRGRLCGRFRFGCLRWFH